MSKGYPPDDPREWLRRARGDLAWAKQPKPPVTPWENPCFAAQQAAEKAIKAVFLHQGKTFPYTHDIEQLLSLLVEAGAAVPANLLEADRLTGYAMGARYPGDEEPATEKDFQEAMALAERVVAWAEKLIGGEK